MKVKKQSVEAPKLTHGTAIPGQVFQYGSSLYMKVNEFGKSVTLHGGDVRTFDTSDLITPIEGEFVY